MSEPSKISSAQEIEERLKRLKNPPQLKYRRTSPLNFKAYTFNDQGKRILQSSEESTSPTPTPSPPSLTPSPLVSSNPPPSRISSPLSPSPPFTPPPEEEFEMAGLGGNNEANQSIKDLSTSTVEGGLPRSIVFLAAADGKSQL
ncbi:probable inactive serine/threonine-protein kinase slob2 [Rosa chinensis]|uniref:probable inactive serine/threonine-protein kinase slob2 n=1 Tax=Rosa chinensis TaxID=74649 RepID=UPI000D089A68|nr:probable inactive serine/threonine-protein kinase slob2 [Rosa chinensis]